MDDRSFNLGFACGIAFCLGAAGALGISALLFLKKGVSHD